MQYGLNDNQLDVMKCLVIGMTSKQTSAKLHIPMYEVNRRIYDILKEYHADTRIAAITHFIGRYIAENSESKPGCDDHIIPLDKWTELMDWLCLTN